MKKPDQKEIVAARLDALMKASAPKLDSQQKLADWINRHGKKIGQTTIGRIRRGETNATSKNLRLLADAFGVTVGHMCGEEVEQEITFKVNSEVGDKSGNGQVQFVPYQPGYDNTEPAVTKGKLPLISWVQAGEWSEILDNFQPGDADDWIPCPFNHGPHAFILRVAGFSMHNPTGDKSYSPGEFIAVDPRVEPQNKKMVVVKVDGEETATFKQLIIEPDGSYLLQALNPSWPNRIMAMPPGSRIVGVVIGKWVPE